MRWAASLLTLMTLAATPAAATAQTVADAVFGPGLLRDTAAPVTLHYRYERRGESPGDAATAPITMEIREAVAGGKEIRLDMFEGAARRQPEPMAASEQNPLILVFLQRDVMQMGNLTGGAAGYFQSRIRQAFTAPAAASPVEIDIAGSRQPATRLTIQPFKDDPRIGQFPKFRDKAYEFTVADAVPGGLWRIATRTPDPADGHLILEESMTFERAGP